MPRGTKLRQPVVSPPLRLYAFLTTLIMSVVIPYKLHDNHDNSLFHQGTHNIGPPTYLHTSSPYVFHLDVGCDREAWSCILINLDEEYSRYPGKDVAITVS